MKVDDKGRIDLRGDGRLLLFQRGEIKSQNWYARIRVPNARRYKTISTKTENQRAAERVALDAYEDLYLHLKGGGSINTKTFKQVFNEWKKSITTMGPTRHGGSWDATIDRVETYALKFFGQMRIDQIKPGDFLDYWAWRKTNFNRKAPTNGTLRRERTSILPVFRFAVKRGYLKEVPDMAAPKAPAERRPTFTQTEWKMFYTTLRKWVKEGEKKATSRDRYVAQQYFLILANTGMRVGELRNLKWNDLRTVPTEDGPRLIANVRGKTGVREVVFQKGSEKYVKRLYDMRSEEVAEQAEKEGKAKADNPKPPYDGLVICHKDGRPIQTMKTSFNAVLKEAKLKAEKDGMTRTVYSLRHFYATMRLSHDTSPFLLAKQMGTSVEMLEKFYGQTISAELAARITKGNQTKVPLPNGKAYPFD